MKTSVEWLANQIENDSDTHFHNINWDKFDELINQAKERELSQMITTWNIAHQAGRFKEKGITEKFLSTWEEYYNENFES
jgi:hypothetical protein